jgi:hypothetical protein
MPTLSLSVPAARPPAHPLVLGWEGHKFTGEDAVAFSFGVHRFLTGYMNSLWTVSKPTEETPDARIMYPADWPRTAESVMFERREEARFVWIKGAWVEKAKEIYLYVVYESSEYGLGVGKACRTYSTTDATFKLILLQRWFRKSTARTRAKRLALAMALHSRLGDGSLLSIVDTELARTLFLMAT